VLTRKVIKSVLPQQMTRQSPRQRNK